MSTADSERHTKVDISSLAQDLKSNKPAKDVLAPETLQKDHQTNESNKEDSTAGTLQNDQPVSNEKGQDVKLSKNQLKKRRRWEKMNEQKKRRKEQQKEAKRARAKAEGRDLEQERKEQEARTESGEGRRRRQALWDARFAQASSSFQVCIDCSFEQKMTGKEISSLALQLRYCYASNRRSSKPSYFTATSLSETGTTLEHLQKVSGFEGWESKGFKGTAKSLEEHFKPQFSNLVYLTSDSENVLDALENDKIYIIGGIVDRNRLKRAAIDRAEALGVKTAKLPLDSHLEEMESTHVLTCNHVFDILLKYREFRNKSSNGTSELPWRQALEAVLPSRKGAKFTKREQGKTKKDDNNNGAS